MDPKILRYYNRELQHVREMGAEFAREYPKIAGRLGLEGFECADPYVERLLEGFAYLAARVQLKVDAEFPTFTQHLLQIIYPHYLAPTPSMAIAQFQPDLKEAGLALGYKIPRGTAMRSIIGKDDRTPCDYRTAHDLNLWPLEVKEAKYFSSTAGLAAIGITPPEGVRAGLRLTFRATAGVPLSALALDNLTLHISGADELPGTLYEAIFANNQGFAVRAPNSRTGIHSRDRTKLERCGFEDTEALIPYGRRSFQGYRLLHEYFAFPERFLFFTLNGLGTAVRALPGNEFEVVILLNRALAWLEAAVSGDNFRLFCTPIINLVDKRADRIHLDGVQHEYQIVADRTRPVDFEIYDVVRAEGYGSGTEPEVFFEPFYSSTEATWHGRQKAFFTIRREPRALSSKQRAQGPRSSYIGSEVFISLVDADQAPYASNLRQLGLEVVCTNRDLPLHMPIGKGQTDFTVDIGAPLTSIRCIAGPTKPRESTVYGEYAWRVLSHLSLNYLSLLESASKEGATALREMLLLYSDPHDVAVQRQIDGVREIHARPTTGRLPAGGPVSYVRGLDIQLTCEDAAFQGQGPFVLGAVLDEFLRRHVALNSFTRLTLKTLNRGEVMRWPARQGQRQIL
ncbi:type VI secretion system protein ImpG [Povalibacter uvarum]|uniref:Type VI secretion system protein ImpG n=1 Tax=Povalibacter uvarum TaxID=732238 RepID=A0A841HI37_9GAMM|nr:type VI secretion system baseplate subunit TssF [Povalibacter uvarum]MBB6091970.1 type VI secretion system protein ImpG [Povalibacter uvarum]